MKKEFDLTDLVVIENMTQTFNKMNKIFENVEKKMIEAFNRTPQKRVITKNHITDNLSYSSYVMDIFSDKASSVYMNFSSSDNNSYSLYTEAYLLIERDCNYFHIFDEHIKKLEELYNFNFVKNNHGIIIFNREPLVSFIHSDKQFENIENWFVKKIFDFKKLNDVVVKL